MPAPRDPRDVLAATPPPGERPAGPISDGIDELLVETGRWLDGRIRRRATETGLVAEDISQELRVRLLRSSTRVEPENPGVKTWLAKQVDWTVADLLRRRGADVPRPPDSLLDAQSEQPEPTAGPDELASAGDLTVQRLIGLGLSLHQAEAIAAKCSPHDIPLKALAQLVRRSAPAVRQDLHRGLRRLEDMFGLKAAEAEAVRTWRRHRSTDSAAAELGMTAPELRALLDDAHKKIDRVFTDREGRS